jgi:hypothetical protein
VTHPAGDGLSALVAASPEFAAVHKDIQDAIGKVVQRDALVGNIDYHDLAEPKKTVPPPLLGFHIDRSSVDRAKESLRMVALIGSFQGVNLWLNDFNVSGSTWTASLSYQYFDHYGVDDSDTIWDGRGHGTPGQVAFWVLQRERHPGHFPYIVEVWVNATASDSF